MFSRFVAGQLTEAVIIGMLCFLGMSIFKMPYAPLISTIVGCTALIPIFGAFIGTAVGAFVLLMVKPITAFWFIVFIIVLQQLEGNIIYPRVVGSSIGLPGIWVLFTVTVCGGIFGIMGMLVGIPLVSIAYCLFRNMVASRLARKKVTHKEIEQAGEDLMR
ncbi:MAG: AI-2E family transporter [Oscillospiraceae bacterium]